MVIISHTDCDSVLSASIMAGELPLDDKFGPPQLLRIIPVLQTRSPMSCSHSTGNEISTFLFAISGRFSMVRRSIALRSLHISSD